MAIQRKEGEKAASTVAMDRNWETDSSDYCKSGKEAFFEVLYVWTVVRSNCVGGGGGGDVIPLIRIKEGGSREKIHSIYLLSKTDQRSFTVNRDWPSSQVSREEEGKMCFFSFLPIFHQGGSHQYSAQRGEGISTV